MCAVVTYCKKQQIWGLAQRRRPSRANPTEGIAIRKIERLLDHRDFAQTGRLERNNNW
jgi:hypothetical protein